MTFYFYDLETSGVDPKSSRIMQFAGQRVDENLEIVGEPDDIYIRMTRDILPDPDAVMLTGITPQKTIADGITEAEFIKYFASDIQKDDTVFVGFNNVRFDDEFMRYMMYRNYYDSYEWHWKNGCSRWDLLDVVRLTRALRPDGIKWPVDSEGRATNRLELITALNGIDHQNAHTALSDVYATIAVAKLIKDKQPKLFDYLMNMRKKAAVKELVMTGEPFVYVSGRYESRYEKTTLAVKAAELPDGSGAIVYDLRFDPTRWQGSTEEELREAMFGRHENYEDRLPFKALSYNRCPALAPRSVVDKATAERLSIDWPTIEKNLQALHGSQELVAKVENIMKAKKQYYQMTLDGQVNDPEARLYDGFLSDGDRKLSGKVWSASAEQLKEMQPKFEDERLNLLWPSYLAHNYPKLMTDQQRNDWESAVSRKLFEGAGSPIVRYLARLDELAKRNPDEKKRYLI